MPVPHSGKSRKSERLFGVQVCECRRSKPLAADTVSGLDAAVHFGLDLLWFGWVKRGRALGGGGDNDSMK